MDMLASLHTLYVSLGIERTEDFGRVLRAREVRRSTVSLPGDGTIVSNFTYRDSARYADQVKRYMDIFGTGKVHIILHDDFTRDVAATYEGTLRFLDVDPGFQPYFRIVDPSTHARVRALHALEVRYGERIRRLFRSGPGRLGPVVHGALRHLKKLNQRVGRISLKDPRLRRELQHEFGPDVERLSQLNRPWIAGDPNA